MKFDLVAVVGAGVIGVGVAQSLAQTGHRVILVDLSDEILGQARSVIANNLKYGALFDRALRETSHAEILARITCTTDYGPLQAAEFVIENVTEDWSAKKSVYEFLDQRCPPNCILAANTSTFSITRLAAQTNRPAQVIGMHFMNPVPQKKVVEVIKGWHTSQETLDSAMDFLKQMRKRAVVVNDMPGFVSNRVLMLTINEAIFLIQDGVASPRDVDEIFVECIAHKMGPLATADLIGLDTVLLSLDALYQTYHDSKYRACPLLRQMVDAGLRGRKAGKGFFDYST